jgi:ATP-binding cassette subfamily B multidrug efflux pump
VETLKINAYRRLVLQEEQEDDRRPFNRQYLARLAGYLKPYRGAVITVCIASIAGIIFSLLGPYLIKIGIDEYIVPRQMAGFSRIILFLVLTIAGQYLSLLLQGVLAAKAGQNAIFDLRQELFNHLQSLSLGFFDQQKAGRLITRVTNDIDSLQQLLSSGITTLVTDTLSFFGVFVFMIWMDWRLTLVTLINLPIIIWLVFYVRRRLLMGWRQIRKKLANVNATLNESLSGIRVTKAFSREEENYRLFAGINNEHFQATMKVVPLSGFFWSSVNFVNHLGTALILGIGGLLLHYGWVTLGVVAAFMNYVNRLFQPIMNLSTLFNMIATAMASCERIFELLDIEAQVKEVPDPVPIGTIRGEIEFRNVSFKYAGSDEVLHDFSLHVKPGETVALVGPTGAGKTTVINVLCRFYDITGGQILIDGVDLQKISLKDYRQQIAIVLQDNFIFSGSIEENIKYGRADATRDQVIAVAKAIGIHDFITSLPAGYATQVHERGSRLSMGQRQLIAFARALLRDPKILILDEATSSIDTQTELAIQIALKRILTGRTAFIIAHRLSTIKRADRIVVIHGGRIVEEGKHDQLLAKDGLYRRLYASQFREA